MNQAFVDILHLVAPSVIRKDFYIECQPGWFPIIYRAAERLHLYNLNTGRPTSEKGCIVADQIKEKFGTMRFYISDYTPEAEEIVQEAERESELTCEYCGDVGELRNRGWLRTLCDWCDIKTNRP